MNTATTATAVLPKANGHYDRVQLPKHVQEALTHIKPAPYNEQVKAYYGYTYRFYRPDNYIWLTTHQQNAERFTKWAQRHHADSFIHSTVTFTDKEHRKPYYKRDYVLIVITDPVAYQLEKAGLLK